MIPATTLTTKIATTITKPIIIILIIIMTAQ